MAAGYCYCLGINSNDFFLKDNKNVTIGRVTMKLTLDIVTQTMKHLGIAHFLFFTEPMKVLALVLGSKLTNH